MSEAANGDDAEIFDGDPPGSPEIAEVSVDPTGLPPETLDRIVKAESTKMLAGLVAGLVVIGLGVALLILGVAGQVDFEFTKDDTNAKLSTAAVGVVVALIGLAIIWITRFKLVVGKRKGNR